MKTLNFSKLGLIVALLLGLVTAWCVATPQQAAGDVIGGGCGCDGTYMKTCSSRPGRTCTATVDTCNTDGDRTCYVSTSFRCNTGSDCWPARISLCTG